MVVKIVHKHKLCLSMPYHKAARQGEAYVNGEGRCSASMTNYYPMPHSQLLRD